MQTFLKAYRLLFYCFSYDDVIVGLLLIILFGNVCICFQIRILYNILFRKMCFL